MSWYVPWMNVPAPPKEPKDEEEKRQLPPPTEVHREETPHVEIRREPSAAEFSPQIASPSTGSGRVPPPPRPPRTPPPPGHIHLRTVYKHLTITKYVDVSALGDKVVSIIHRGNMYVLGGDAVYLHPVYRIVAVSAGTVAIQTGGEIDVNIVERVGEFVGLKKVENLEPRYKHSRVEATVEIPGEGVATIDVVEKGEKFVATKIVVEAPRELVEKIVNSAATKLREGLENLASRIRAVKNRSLNHEVMEMLSERYIDPAEKLVDEIKKLLDANKLDEARKRLGELRKIVEVLDNIVPALERISRDLNALELAALDPELEDEVEHYKKELLSIAKNIVESGSVDYSMLEQQLRYMERDIDSLVEKAQEWVKKKVVELEKKLSEARKILDKASKTKLASEIENLLVNLIRSASMGLEAAEELLDKLKKLQPVDVQHLEKIVEQVLKDAERINDLLPWLQRISKDIETAEKVKDESKRRELIEALVRIASNLVQGKLGFATVEQQLRSLEAEISSALTESRETTSKEEVEKAEELKALEKLGTFIARAYATLIVGAHFLEERSFEEASKIFDEALRIIKRGEKGARLSDRDIKVLVRAYALAYLVYTKLHQELVEEIYDKLVSEYMITHRLIVDPNFEKKLRKEAEARARELEKKIEELASAILRGKKPDVDIWTKVQWAIKKVADAISGWAIQLGEQAAKYCFDLAKKVEKRNPLLAQFYELLGWLARAGGYAGQAAFDWAVITFTGGLGATVLGAAFAYSLIDELTKALSTDPILAEQWSQFIHVIRTDPEARREFIISLGLAAAATVLGSAGAIKSLASVARIKFANFLEKLASIAKSKNLARLSSILEKIAARVKKVPKFNTKTIREIIGEVVPQKLGVEIEQLGNRLVIRILEKGKVVAKTVISRQILRNAIQVLQKVGVDEDEFVRLVSAYLKTHHTERDAIAIAELINELALGHIDEDILQEIVDALKNGRSVSFIAALVRKAHPKILLEPGSELTIVTPNGKVWEFRVVKFADGSIGLAPAGKTLEEILKIAREYRITPNQAFVLWLKMNKINAENIAKIEDVWGRNIYESIVDAMRKLLGARSSPLIFALDEDHQIVLDPVQGVMLQLVVDRGRAIEALTTVLNVSRSDASKALASVLLRIRATRRFGKVGKIVYSLAGEVVIEKPNPKLIDYLIRGVPKDVDPKTFARIIERGIETGAIPSDVGQQLLQQVRKLIQVEELTRGKTVVIPVVEQSGNTATIRLLMFTTSQSVKQAIENIEQGKAKVENLPQTLQLLGIKVETKSESIEIPVETGLEQCVSIERHVKGQRLVATNIIVQLEPQYKSRGINIEIPVEIEKGVPVDRVGAAQALLESIEIPIALQPGYKSRSVGIEIEIPAEVEISRSVVVASVEATSVGMPIPLKPVYKRERVDVPERIDIEVPVSVNRRGASIDSFVGFGTVTELKPIFRNRKVVETIERRIDVDKDVAKNIHTDEAHDEEIYQVLEAIFMSTTIPVEESKETTRIITVERIEPQELSTNEEIMGSLVLVPVFVPNYITLTIPTASSTPRRRGAELGRPSVPSLPGQRMSVARRLSRPIEMKEVVVL